MVESGALGGNFGMLRGREERNSHLIMWVIGRSTPRKADMGARLMLWTPPDIDCNKGTERGTTEGCGASLWEYFNQGSIKS